MKCDLLKRNIQKQSVSSPLIHLKQHFYIYNFYIVNGFRITI